jgi:hypothetical protein
VALARAVLESASIRAAEAVLEASDSELLPRLSELLTTALAVGCQHAAKDRRYR